MNWALILSTIIAIAIYVLILLLFSWLFHIKTFVSLMRGGSFEFRKWSGWFSFSAFLIAIFVLLNDRAVKFIENLLLIIAGNSSNTYQINDSIVFPLFIALSYLLLNFIILTIFEGKKQVNILIKILILFVFIKIYYLLTTESTCKISFKM